MDDDLRAAEAEGRDQHLAAARQRAAHHVAHAGRHLVHAFVNAAAVGAFADQQVGRRHHRRLAQERQAAPAEVAGEGDAADAGRPRDGQLRHRRAEDVPRVHEAQPDVRRHVMRRLVGDDDALLGHAMGVRTAVQRRRSCVRPVNDAGNYGVVFVDAGRIAEHHGRQVARGRRAVDRPGKALVNQVGKVAAVVHVGVTEDHGVDFSGGEGEAKIASLRLVAGAAHEAAVEQDASPGRLHQMHGTCYRLGRAPKRHARAARRVCRIPFHKTIIQERGKGANRIWQRKATKCPHGDPRKRNRPGNRSAVAGPSVGRENAKTGCAAAASAVRGGTSRLTRPWHTGVPTNALITLLS